MIKWPCDYQIVSDRWACELVLFCSFLSSDSLSPLHDIQSKLLPILFFLLLSQQAEAVSFCCSLSSACSVLHFSVNRCLFSIILIFFNPLPSPFVSSRLFLLRPLASLAASSSVSQSWWLLPGPSRRGGWVRKWEIRMIWCRGEGWVKTIGCCSKCFYANFLH